MLLNILFLLTFEPINVTEETLKNGLKILIYEDHFAPVVSTQIHYRVGSYNEPSGLTGISHLLEHMAFKGTKRYGPKEYDRIIDEAGGEENAFTSTHQTVYWANLYKDRYELEIMLEADRMKNLLIAEKEFVPEKMVVMEERRLGENDPYGSLFETLDLVTYFYHPYRNPVIGFMTDLEKISRDDVYKWYKKYYNPANAIIVISGDVDKKEAIRLVARHFEKIKGKPLQEPEFTEPPQNGERRFTLYKEVNFPALVINFRTVKINHPDSYVLDVISKILSFGESSRFKRILIRQKSLAVDLDAYSSVSKYDGTFSIFGIPQSKVSIEKLEEEIYLEIERLKSGDITDKEIEKAKNQTLAQFVFRQDSPAGIGFTIGHWEILSGSWQNINLYPEKILDVKKEDIIRVSNQYFTEENRTVGYLMPRR
uniref:Insulinase family protein n=1 Tax=candidate division WOR-3 bacterium TaxID=2052148 RepID=A0A7C4TI17_UNCW3